MTINLVPPQSKRERRTKQLLRGFYLSAAIVFFYLLLIAVFIYLTNFLIQSNIMSFDKKIDEKTAQVAKYKDLETAIRQTNFKLDSLKKSNAEKIIWSEIIQELSKSTPANVKINSLSMDKTTNSISLSGIAETRKDIADMKDELELSTLFTNVTFNSSIYSTEAKDYTFTIDAKLEGL